MRRSFISRYTKKVRKRITKDYGYARWCFDIFYASPSFFYKKARVIRALYDSPTRNTIPGHLHGTAEGMRRRARSSTFDGPP